MTIRVTSFGPTEIDAASGCYFSAVMFAAESDFKRRADELDTIEFGHAREPDATFRYDDVEYDAESARQQVADWKALAERFRALGDAVASSLGPPTEKSDFVLDLHPLVVRGGIEPEVLRFWVSWAIAEDTIKVPDAQPDTLIRVLERCFSLR